MSNALQIEKAICVSDCHGSHLTLMEMLRQHGAGRQLILLGDLIDRGPRSREVVEYAMQNDVPTCGGNHEDLAIAYSAHAKLGYRAKASRYYDRDVWLYNGGDVALKSWGLHRGQSLPKGVLDWMASLPPYIILDIPNSQGRKALLSHTGYGFDADKDNWLRALWGRYPDDGEFSYAEGTGAPVDDGYLRVYGHTRVKDSVITPTHVNIDGGCAYQGYGRLFGYLWPEGQVVSIDNID